MSDLKHAKLYLHRSVYIFVCLESSRKVHPVDLTLLQKAQVIFKKEKPKKNGHHLCYVRTQHREAQA